MMMGPNGGGSGGCDGGMMMMLGGSSDVDGALSDTVSTIADGYDNSGGYNDHGSFNGHPTGYGSFSHGHASGCGGGNIGGGGGGGGYGGGSFLASVDEQAMHADNGNIRDDDDGLTPLQRMNHLGIEKLPPPLPGCRARLDPK
jgi:hypothetical protein